MSELLFELIKRRTTFLAKFPREVFSSEPYEENDNVGVPENETLVEVAEP